VGGTKRERFAAWTQVGPKASEDAFRNSAGVIAEQDAEGREAVNRSARDHPVIDQRSTRFSGAAMKPSFDRPDASWQARLMEVILSIALICVAVLCIGALILLVVRETRVLPQFAI
jgi:hypothetical protein